MPKTETSPASDLLKVAVIGAGGGHALKRLYPCLHRLPIDLAAVCDLDAELAKRTARNFGARSSYSDYTAMLAELELDAVIVCIGPEQHERIAVEIMEAGLPVYTEKPPSVTSAGSRVMLEASRRTGKICMTGFCKRFSPAYAKAKVAAGEPGFGAAKLLTVEWSYGPALYTLRPDVPRWSFLLDFGIHAIDTARFLAGEVAEVYARAQPDESSHAIHLSFADGAFGVLSMSDHRYGLAEHMELIGDAGNTLVIANGGNMVQYRDAEVVSRYEKPFTTADSLVENGYQGELDEFVAAVAEGREPESSIASAHETMRLYDAIVRSEAESRPVTLDEIE